MNLANHDVVALADLAEMVARRAGEMIESAPSRAVDRKAGSATEASSVVTDVDIAVEKMMVRSLRDSRDRFALGLLGEESSDDGSRHVCDYFWCIDPLDGTLPFSRSEPGYSVSIALVRRDGFPVLGVVFDPLAGVLYRATKGQGTTRNGALLRAPELSKLPAASRMLSVAMDRSFCGTPEYTLWKEELDALAGECGLAGVEERVGAGAVLCACEGLLMPSLYFRLPKSERAGGRLWDFAASACIFREAGASATDIFGAELELNRRESTSMNHRGVIYASESALSFALQARIRHRLGTHS